MKLGINFEDERDDVFHSHGYAKVAYGKNLGSASPTPGGGRAGDGGIGAVGTYHYADVSYRHKRDHAGKNGVSGGKGSSRFTLQVKEREGESKAAFSHRDPSEAGTRSFREPPGRPFNPYT